MKKILILVIILGVVALGTASYTGLFSSIAFEERNEGPFYVVYEDHEGAYQLIQSVIKDVTKRLDEQNIPYGDGIAVLYDDPKTVPADQLKSKGGVLVGDQVSVDSPMAFTSLPYNHYLVGTFSGMSAVGTMRVYKKAEEWMKANGKTLNGPIIEIYNGKGIKQNIFYYFPIN